VKLCGWSPGISRFSGPHRLKPGLQPHGRLGYRQERREGPRWVLSRRFLWRSVQTLKQGLLADGTTAWPLLIRGVQDAATPGPTNAPAHAGNQARARAETPDQGHGLKSSKSSKRLKYPPEKWLRYALFMHPLIKKLKKGSGRLRDPCSKSAKRVPAFPSSLMQRALRSPRGEANSRLGKREKLEKGGRLFRRPCVPRDRQREERGGRATAQCLRGPSRTPAGQRRQRKGKVWAWHEPSAQDKSHPVTPCLHSMGDVKRARCPGWTAAHEPGLPAALGLEGQRYACRNTRACGGAVRGNPFGLQARLLGVEDSPGSAQDDHFKWSLHAIGSRGRGLARRKPDRAR
jgi:hypothetical protein